jgi:hypothetical protein
MRLANRLTLAYPFQTTRVGGGAISLRNWLVICTYLLVAPGSLRREFMATKKAKKTTKGLKKGKKLEKTLPLEHNKGGWR